MRFYVGDKVRVKEDALVVGANMQLLRGSIGTIDDVNFGDAKYLSMGYWWNDCDLELIERYEEKETTGSVNTSREKCLDTAKTYVCKDRDEQYGQPENSFPVIAKLWSAYKGVEFTAEEAAMMLGLLKVARTKTGKYKADNYIDLCGYVACACEIGKGEE